MLRFIVGRAGSGKTRLCLRSVVADLAGGPAGPPLVLLVPEQATFQLEQALIRTGARGYARASVLSFQRLAWQVLEETGGGGPPLLSEVGRRLTVRAELADRRTDLRIFGRVADRPGFIERLALTLEELASCGIGPAEIEGRLAALAASGRSESLLAAKLHDLRLVQTGLRDRLAGRLSAPEERLDRLCEHLPAAAWPRGARVWVDGFAGFTPQELRALGVLLTVAAEVQVTLCLDPREPEAADDLETANLFHPTRETRRQVAAVAAAAGVPRAPDVVLDGRPRRFRAAVLAHVEREFGRFPGRRFRGTPGADGVLTLLAAPNPRAEVEGAAREVLRLVRDGGCRFRDVAVVLRDVEAYHDLIDTCFRARAIPYFVDRRRPVPHHPLVELIRSALGAVAADWPYEAVFGYLKTDLVPVSRADVDRLENYVLAFGLRGRQWYGEAEWTFRRRFTLEEDEPADSRAEAELRRLAGARRAASEALRHVHGRIARYRGRPGPVTELTAALSDLLAELGVAERLADWSRQAEAEGDMEGAQEHPQVWNGVVELLDQTVECLGDHELTVGEYAGVVEAGLDGLRVGLVPAGLDQVLVGTVERSRHPEVRAVLLLGATDQAYPRRASEDALLSDPEREELGAAGLTLAPTSRLRLLHEQYLAYIALTRAAERLWISYPQASADGAATTPAFLMRRLQALVPGLRPLPVAAGDDPDAVATPGELALALAHRLRAARDGGELDGVWLDIYRSAMRDPELHGRLAGPLAALDYDNRVEPLPAAVAHALYGDPLIASVSRLEGFAACPFRHFAAYGLRLRPREIQRLDPAGFGQLYHAALSLAARRVAAPDWATLDRPAARQLVADVLGELQPRLENELLAGTGRGRQLMDRVARTLETAVGTLAEHARRSRFRSRHIEAAFGPEPEAALPPLDYALPGGGRLVLHGRIDRVETAELPDGRHLLRVIDYKSRPRELRPELLYHGLTLQLGLYLLAAAAALGVEPAGLLYLPVHDPLLRADAPLPDAEVERRRRRLLRAGGWVLADPEAIRAMDESNLGDLVPARLTAAGQPRRDAHSPTRKRMRAALDHLEEHVRGCGRDILQGQAAVAPYRLGDETPCGHCEFGALCGFDPRVAGNGYRRLVRLDAAAVWERLDPAEAGPRRDPPEGGRDPGA